MTIKKCKKEISTQAKKCPYCGFEKTNPIEAIRGFLVLALILFIAWVYFSSNDSDLSAESTQTTVNNSSIDKQIRKPYSDYQYSEQEKIETGYSKCAYSGFTKWLFNTNQPVKLVDNMANRFDVTPSSIISTKPFMAIYKGSDVIDINTKKVRAYECRFEFKTKNTTYKFVN